MEPPVLGPAAWRARQEQHEARVAAWTQPHVERARRGEGHPVLDFLFTYYSYRPAQLRRWHPGAGVVLAGDPPHRDWPGYHRVPGGVCVDLAPLAGRRGDALRHITRLLRGTAARPASFGCFGMHEWAMVHRAPAAEVRHAAWPLRLPPDELAAVVEEAPLSARTSTRSGSSPRPPARSTRWRPAARRCPSSSRAAAFIRTWICTSGRTS